MRGMKMLRAALCVTLLAGACGDNNGDGTTDTDDGDTTAPTTTASVAGGPRRAALDEVTLTADEPATIYYTTDGSAPTATSPSGPSPVSVADPGATLRFFAIDTAGNEETPKQLDWSIDALGPAPVADLIATGGLDAIDLSWSNPTAAGFTDVVLARIDDAAAAIPTDGSALAVGDAFAGGEVVYVGTAASFVDLGRHGTSTYVALARYADNAAYSEPRFASAATTAPQTGTITITAAGVATVDAPPGYAMTVDNVVAAVPLAGIPPTWSFDVNLTRNLEGAAFNTKLIATNVSGALTGMGGIDIDAGPYTGLRMLRFGSLRLDAGAAATASSIVTTTGPDVVIDFEIVTGPAQIGQDWTPDGSAPVRDLVVGYSTFDEFEPAPVFPGLTRSYGGYRGGQVTPDGRYMIAGTRNMPILSKIDLATGATVQTLELATTHGASTGALPSCRLAASGTRMYCILQDGMHTYAYFNTLTDATDQITSRANRPMPDGNAVYVIEIDPRTMTEVRRVELFDDAVDLLARGTRVALSPDDRQAVAVVGTPWADAPSTSVHLIDLATWTLRDTDDAVAGYQPLAPAARVTACGFDIDASHLACNASVYGDGDGDNVTVYDLATMASTVIDLDGVVDSDPTQVKTFMAMPDGTMLAFGYTDAPGTPRFDPTSGVVTAFGTDAPDMEGRAVTRSGSAIYVSARNSLTILEANGDVRLTLPNTFDRDYSHDLALTPF